MSLGRRIGLAAILLMLAPVGACGSTYTLRDGGWTLRPAADGAGTCLTVHGDGDPEVMRVCIVDPDPLRIDRDILDPLCQAAGGPSGSD